MCWRKKKKNNGLKHFVRADTRAASRSEWRPRDHFTLSVPAVVLSERGKSALRKLYSSLLVSTYSEQFSFFQVKPQLPHSRFSTPSRALSLFFPGVASPSRGFLTTHGGAQEACRLKTGPCHCFHSSLRTTELNLTPITRSQVPKNTRFHTQRGLI